MSVRFSRVLVTGGSGFLGTHVGDALTSAGYEVIRLGRRDGDLRERGVADRLLDEIRPDAVCHLAAKVGGIVANRTYPGEFFSDNILINTHTFNACVRSKVSKLVTFIGGCAYPGDAASPIEESAIWSGYPQADNEAFAMAQRMVLAQSRAYRAQYGFNSIVLIPGNLYGEHDNFSEEFSHVVPALIRRFIEARDDDLAEVVCFGSGTPTRDFVYVKDVAALVPWFLEHYDCSEPINLSSGTCTSIRTLAETIRQVTGFSGTIRWDTGMPDGQLEKIFDVSRLREHGLSCSTPLAHGLEVTASWFERARSESAARL